MNEHPSKTPLEIAKMYDSQLDFDMYANTVIDSLIDDLRALRHVSQPTKFELILLRFRNRDPDITYETLAPLFENEAENPKKQAQIAVARLNDKLKSSGIHLGRPENLSINFKKTQ